jgi:ribosomal protein S12 methylthiotransferase accessory factor
MSTSLWSAIERETERPRYLFGTHRAVVPSETLARIGPLLRPAGITRLADITGLDWVGVPVYQAVRPDSRILAVSQGKGLTRVQARVSALMEALEGFHAEEITQPARWETVGDMRRELPYDPYALPRFEAARLDDGTVLEWIAATDLWTGSATWVPRRLCQLDFRTEERYQAPLFRTSTNGLASGNTVAEAVIHGLCEVIERDACWRNRRARLSPERNVVSRSVSSGLSRRLIERFARVGLTLDIVDVSGPTGLPCFEVWLDHRDGPALVRGAGCHPSRTTALVRALTEAAQSRLTFIAGSRDDLRRREYRGAASGLATPGHQLTVTPRRTFASAPTLPATDFAAQARDIAGRVRRLTGMSPVAVDLRRPDFQLPVVFVVAAGLRARIDL